MLPFDRREFIAALGGTAAVGLMSHEARADAIEDALLARTQAPLAMAAADYRRAFGIDYVPVPHVQRDYAMVRNSPVAHMLRTLANPDAPL